MASSLAIRKELDTLGEVNVPASRYYGAQTARAMMHFRIGDVEERMPLAIIRAFGLLKKASAQVNCQFGLDRKLAEVISQVCDEVIAGTLDDDFPLMIWQTGSGTQTNMNVNEVIANRAIELLGGQMGSKKPVHPNDHVNMSQSSNDTYPTAMHIAVVCELHSRLFPCIEKLRDAFNIKAKQFDRIVLIRKKQLPLNLSETFHSYAQLLDTELNCVHHTMPRLYMLAAGGTAVGTGLNAPLGFAEKVAEQIATLTGFPFVTAPNKFESLAAHDVMVECHGALNTLAASLMKIVTEMRSIGNNSLESAYKIDEAVVESAETSTKARRREVRIEMNVEHCDVIAMVAAQVFGNQMAVTVGASNGHFELNTFKPMIVCNVLHSVRLIADSCQSFAVNCVENMHILDASI
ncbi:putative fumarate hydratase, mitochondrial [Toxocara canis]|uniref:fumarate hydratase n=2 Tax=Toxocara canis TaxID=6265 RepID=A0A0B2VCA2_TOXCA|nr:putative fumarate hydratase, mitochondrial [Toxocara canis]VDM41710.1 unnamed protein product [Toxocara canis]